MEERERERETDRQTPFEQGQPEQSKMLDLALETVQKACKHLVNNLS
jgi:hypothetical protein